VPLAIIRPDDWNLPLFVHVLGAMLLVGTLLLAGIVLLWRRDGPTPSRLGFRVLLLGVLPSYVVMRVGAQWVYSVEGFGGEDPDWIAVGYITSDAGALLLLVALVLTGIAARRERRANVGGAVLTRIAGGIAYLLLVAYVVAVWAMTAKPGA
jgi:hypothetical protein